MLEFYAEHGATVVSEILNGAPLDASHFIYAFVAKSTDYLKYDGEILLVWYQHAWKVVKAQFIIDSFKDMVQSLEALKELSKQHELVNMYGGVPQAEGRLEYFDWMPHRNAEYHLLNKAVQAVRDTQKFNHRLIATSTPTLS